MLHFCLFDVLSSDKKQSFLYEKQNFMSPRLLGWKENVYSISLAGFDRDIRASKQISTKPR